MKRLVLILALLATSSSFALGQAIPGATRRIDISAGASFSFGFPDYTPQKAVGYGIFATADITPHWGAELDFHSLSILQHSPSKELTFEYGVRYHRDYGRFSPYLRASAGRGTFDSIQPFYQGSASPGYNLVAFGGGVDTAITSRISVRAAAEYQNWFTGGVKGPPNSGGPGTNVYLPNGLTPAIIEIGVSYHITGSPNIR